jgi:arylsulfatase A-like enzyme
VSLQDIYPTLVELVGLERPAHVQGRSLVPLLTEPSVEWNHPTLSTYGFGNHAVVSDRFKYIRYNDGSEELYDVREDPNEWQNLAVDAAYDDVKRELARHLPKEDAPDLARRGGRAGGAGRADGAGGAGRADAANAAENPPSRASAVSGEE